MRSRMAVAALGISALVVIGSAAAIAGSCRVLVAIGSVDMEPSPAGMSLRLSGSWEFDNIVQVVSGLSFNVLLVRGDNFVRLHYPQQSSAGFVTGLGSEIDEGIDGSDIIAVEAAGNVEPTARFVSFEAQRIKISSPVPPGQGPISVVAYLVLDGDYVSPIISNTITRPLEMLPPVGSTDEDPTDPDGTGGTVGDPPPPPPPVEEPATDPAPEEPVEGDPESDPAGDPLPEPDSDEPPIEPTDGPAPDEPSAESQP